MVPDVLFLFAIFFCPRHSLFPNIQWIDPNVSSENTAKVGRILKPNGLRNTLNIKL